MFPTENEEIQGGNPKPTSEIEKHSYIFDFTTGEFLIQDGKLKKIENIEALKIWIQKNIYTDIKSEKIYTKFGVDIIRLLNQSLPQSFLEEEIKRQVKDALISNDKITNINDFIFERNGRTLNCGFTCETIYGDILSEVALT